MPDSRIDKLASLLVRYSTGVRKKNVVSLVGPPLAEPLIVALYREVMQAGGHPFVVMVPEACAELMYRLGSPDQLAFINPLEVPQVEAVDVSIHVLAPENTRALATLEPHKIALHHKVRRSIMDLFLLRAAKKNLRWVVTQYPCQASAQDAEMSLAEYADFVYQSALLDQPDPAAAWQALSARQARLIEWLRPARELHFLTPAGTDLRVSVAGRTWLNGDGHENFPDGEVFTAPLENATEGVVCCDFPAVHGNRQVTGARLRFQAGRVVDASAETGQDFLIAMLDQDEGARVLGEIGLGCNYAISRFSRNILFDEKMGGTFHIALGAAYPSSGGINQSALHWDMVCDLRPGGRIEADGQVISQNGKFQSPEWKTD